MDSAALRISMAWSERSAVLGGNVMSLLCRMGHHTPARKKALIDIDDLKQEACCKRCGAPMQRVAGSPWRLQDAT